MHIKYVDYFINCFVQNVTYYPPVFSGLFLRLSEIKTNKEKLKSGSGII